jgi:hypothetical protein
MGIGLPLLAVLNVCELRAVLAHEFAHFYSGDTSLSPWVYRTQTSIVRVFQNLGELDAFAQVNAIRMLMELVVFIVKQYFILFLRVINFISRKQEFRSDEVACLIAGSTSGMPGLQKIHSAAVAWTSYWNSEVAPVVSHNWLPAIAEGFNLFTPSRRLPLNCRPRLRKRKHPPRPAPMILTLLFQRASRPCNRFIHREPIWTPALLCPS